MDFFYDRTGREINLIRQPDKFAVRLVRGRSVADAALTAPSRTLLQNSTAQTFLPEYGLQVFATKGAPDLAETTRGLRGLHTERDVQYASPVFRRAANDGFDILVSNQFSVELKDTTTDSQFSTLNQENYVTVSRRLSYAARGYVLSARDGDGDFGPVELARKYYETGLVTYATPDLIQPRVPRGAPVPANGVPPWRYSAEQWHLNTARLTEAWQYTTGADAITVAIADDGVDTDHVEFVGKVAAQFDFSAGIPDAKPKQPVDRHGTACAGVATARGLAAYGAAPGCRLMPVRFPEQMGSILEGDMFHWMADNGADVISCSWGPPDGRTGYYPLPDNVASAIHYCVTIGRGGRGIPIFWAAGNGNEQISTDGYAANPDVIAIGASTEADTKANYSDFGNELSICAPSSGDSALGQRAILTTDRTGTSGFNPDTEQPPQPDLPDQAYTNSFGGTSSAAPLAAGVAALLLSVNPALSAIDIRQVLQSTADKIGPYPYDQGRNGIFGYGRLNAAAAVAEAIRRVGVVQSATTIIGPTSAAKDGPPVEFQVNTPAGKYFAVEVATKAEFFGPEKANRTDQNFYASWSTGTLQAGSRYLLPAAPWTFLRSADRIYYRLLTSDSSNAWVNTATTTSAGEFATAPSVQLTGGAASPTPTVTAPASYSRSAAAPVFTVNPHPLFYYAVEVASQGELFAPSAAAQRTTTNYFATWNQAPSFFAEPTYQLPDDAWQALRTGPVLYFRIWANGAGGRWQQPIPSEPNGAPMQSIILTQ